MADERSRGGIFSNAFRFLSLGGGAAAAGSGAGNGPPPLPGAVVRPQRRGGLPVDVGDSGPASAASAAAAGVATPSPPSSSPPPATSPPRVTTPSGGAPAAAQPPPPHDADAPPAPPHDAVTAAHVRGSVRCGGLAWEEDCSNVTPTRLARFLRVLEARNVDVEALRVLAWSGVPAGYRLATWQTLLGYLPLNRDRQSSSLAKKVAEYEATVAAYFGGSRGGGVLGKSDSEQSLLRQVLVDVPRTTPDIPLFHTDYVQRSLERVLYVWALRHPASGYVQGINDLATPLFAVFLSPWAGVTSTDLAHVPAEQLAHVEADVYWCLTRLLDGIQDHYTPGQPGIRRMIFRLRELVHRIDEPLVAHLEGSSVEFYQFAFRWCNCLLMRELPFRLVCRLWDTCIAEKDGFDVFYVYVCAALLLKFSGRLKGLAFQELVQFLQKLPTAEWTVKDIEELLSQAYVYKTLFQSSLRWEA